MKKLNLLLLAILCSVGMAWGETEVLSTPSGSVASLTSPNGIVTITDQSGNTGIQAGNVTIQNVTCMKLSGSRNFTLTYAQNVTINSVTLYAISNGNSATNVGTDGNNQNAYGQTNAKGGAVKSFALTGVSGEGLRFSGQSNAVIVVDYTNNLPASDLALTSATSIVLNYEDAETSQIAHTTSSTGAITYTSADPSVATVSNTGLISSVAEGTTTITIAQAADNNYRAGSVTVNVTVKSKYTLVQYLHSATLPTGITLGGTVALNSTAKIHTNTDAVDCIQLANGYTTENVFNGNEIILAVDGGFKVGDILTVAGFFNNSDNTKVSMIDVFTVNNENACTALWTSAQFINGRTVAGDPVEESYVLTADMNEIHIGRNGGTSTYIYTLKVIRPAAPTSVTLNAAGFATFSANEDVEISGATANKAAVEGTTITLTAIADNKVPAHTGVILYGTANATVTVTPLATAPAAVTGNDLLATSNSNLPTGKAVYALAGNEFKLFNGTALTPNKAYFQFDEALAAPMAIVFNEEITAVEDVIAAELDWTKPVFNILGQQVAEGTTGILIQNGVKFIVK